MWESVLNFWFTELKPDQWFEKDPNVDRLIRRRFGDLHREVAACEHYAWRKRPRGRLAEIIVLDQLSRNMFRDSAQAFAYDPLALGLAQEAIAVGADKALQGAPLSFLYMPFMHSESRKIHEIAVGLVRAPGLEEKLGHDMRHKVISGSFGSYPRRNALLGRVSNPEEEEFLRQPGSGF